MFELVKSALQKTSLYPAAKELYRVTWKRSFISNRKRLTDFYRPLVPENAIVFDVGANRGEFADAFLRLGATVYAVEPHPTCTKELKALYGHDRKFNLVDCALGSAPGEALLYLGENGMDNVSTLSEDYRRDAKRLPGLAVAGWNQSIPVRVDTLDHLVDRYGTPDFCKIDVEGYEIEVLRGLHQPLPLLQFEYQPWSVDKAVECVEHLCAQSSYRFNITMSEGREDDAALQPDWSSPEEIIALLRSVVAKSNCVGDVFVSSRSPTSLSP